MKPLLGLLLGAALIGLTGSAVAWWLGPESLKASSIALALCVLPAVLTMAAALRWGKTSRDAFMVFAMGGSLVRMAIVLGTALVLVMQYPGLLPDAFLFWLAFYYLVILGLEVTLLVRHQETLTRSVGPPNPPGPQS